jgi:hypothetical protein
MVMGEDVDSMSKLSNNATELRTVHLRGVQFGSDFKLIPDDSLHTKWITRLRQYRSVNQTIFQF